MPKYIIKKLESLNGIDFEGFWSYAEPHFENYPFPDGVDKLEFIKSRYQSSFTREGSMTFIIKCGDCGHQLVLYTGELDGDTFDSSLILLQDDHTGSRSYIYSTDYQNALEAFYEDLGVTDEIITSVDDLNYVETFFKERRDFVEITADRSGFKKTRTRIKNV